ncbi:MAG: hypothetical protein M3O66_06265, partial [Verrucomicrobiota bacterium]|nr:hypothetical protein [Verrucomicrobiota bacterium]
IMLFLSMRRLGAAHRIACLPAGIAFLSGDHLYLEHVIMADFLLIFLTSAGLTAAVYALKKCVDLRWLCVASALLASAALARSVGLILLPILAVCTCAWVRISLRDRAAVLAAAVLPGLTVFAVYGTAFVLARGAYLGFSDMRAWNLYSRVAPFADCRKFSPPEDTAVLCEETPTSQRSGPFGYIWDANSVARRNFALKSENDKKLGAFATQVILHQPGDYARAVLIDLVRYIEPSIGNNHGYSGQPREIVSFGWRDNSVERFVVAYMSKKYHGAKVHLHCRDMLSTYQNLFRVGGLALATLICLTFVGMIRARGSLRFGIFLFGLSGLGLYVVPVLTVSYDFRYGIPAETFVAVSGLLGALAVRANASNCLNDPS